MAIHFKMTRCDTPSEVGILNTYNPANYKSPLKNTIKDIIIINN